MLPQPFDAVSRPRLPSLEPQARFARKSGTEKVKVVSDESGYLDKEGLQPEDANDLQQTRSTPPGTVTEQLQASLGAPSLNDIIEQSAGSATTAAAASGLGVPNFLTPGLGSVGGIFGGVALGGLTLGGAGGGSAGILSSAGPSSSLLGGRLINGYISGARVFQDQDGDGVWDGTNADDDDDYADEDGNKNGVVDGDEAFFEPFSITGPDGSYDLTIIDGGGSLIAEPLSGTIDESMSSDGDPPVAVTSTFRAPSGATVISPISTLVDAGLSTSQVKTALGIDASIDILNYDPVYEATFGNEPDKALSFKSASVLVSNLLDVGSEVISGAAGSSDSFSDQVVSGIVGVIQESGSTAVDLSDADIIGSALTKAVSAAETDGVALDASITDTITGIKTQIAVANTAVKTALTDHAGDPTAALTQIAKVEKATQTSLATEARAVADPDDTSKTVDTLAGFDLSGAIAAASVNDPVRAYVSATAPARGESGVISIYSDDFTDVPASWSGSAGSITTDEMIETGSSNASIKATGMDSVKVTLTSTLDVSDMSTLFASVWHSEPDADIAITLVDYGVDGVLGTEDDSQHVVTYNVTNNNQIAAGQWTDLEISLNDLTGLTSTENIGEIVFSSRKDGAASGELLYLDNIFFGKTFDGLSFGESYLSAEGSEGAFVPPIVEQSDGNSILGMIKGGLYSHVVLGTGTSNDLSTVDPVDLTSNPVLGMWVHTESAGSEIRVQLGNSSSGGWPNDQNFTEASATTTKAGWNFLTFDFENPTERFVADGATDGSKGFNAATRFDPDLSYDMLSVFPDSSSESAIGRSYYFDALAPYTGTTPPEPMAVAGTENGDESGHPAFTGWDLEGASENYNLVGFQGAEDNVVLGVDPEDDSNTVIQFTKTTDAFYYAGVQLGIGDSETVGPISFDIANDQTAISARIWTPVAGKVVRAEVGDSIFGGAVDINWVQAEATLTEAGWNQVVFDFSNPVERYISSYGRPAYTSLSDTVSYDRLSIFLDWESGEGATPLGSDTVYYIDDISGPGEGLSGGYTVPDGYVLAFEDSFDDIGQRPDPNFWTYDLGDGTDQGIPGWGNEEVQVYQNDLDDVEIVDVGVTEGDTDGTDDGVNGALRITAKRDGDTITSARVKSDIDYLPAYGYYEIRAKLPSEDGAWPALWLLGDVDSGTWPAVGEIDMVEWSSAYDGNSDVTISHALHATNFSAGDAKQWKGDLGTPIDDWHTYQLWWTPDAIKMGVDGGILDAHFTYNKPTGAGNADWPYDDPMDIIMNVAIGGNLGGTNKVPGGSFSYDMYVDYVRVYQTPPVPTAGPAIPNELVNAQDGVVDVPDELDTDVIALWSDTFTEDVTVSWQTSDPGNSIASTLNDLTTSIPRGAGSVPVSNIVKQVTNVTQFTIEPSSVVDTTGAYTFNFTVYRTDPYADLKVKLVDFGADGVIGGSDTTEHEIVFSQANGNAIVSGQWVPIEILMSDLTGLSNQSAIGQIMVSSHQAGTSTGSGETIYLDDVLFSPPPAPESGPTSPTDSSSNVISLFSDQADYNNLSTTSWSSDTDEASVAEVSFPDTTTAKKYAGVNYIEIEPASVVDASLMDTLKVDVWRGSDTADLKLKLIDYGADGVEGGTDNTEHEITLNTANGYPNNVVGDWTHIDIPLADMSGLTSSSNIGKIVISSHKTGTTDGAGETLYLDNLYFSRPEAPLAINFEIDDNSGFDIDAARASMVGADSFELRDSPVLDMPGSVGYLRNNNSESESGMTLIELSSDASLLSPGNETISMKVFLFEQDVAVRLRLEDVTDGDYVDLTAVTGAGMEAQTISWDFANDPSLDHTNNYSKASVYFDITHPVVFFDDIQFNGAVLGD